MKKRLAALLTCALCAVTMCLALVGCGGSASAGKAMVGYWELTGGTANGEKLTAEDVEFMSSLDVKFIIYLGEDGSAIIDTFGTVEDVTWDVNKATMVYSGETVTLKLSDETLTLTDGGSNELLFKKGDESLADKIEKDRKALEESAAGTEAEAGTESKTQRVAIDPPVALVDDEYATITAVARVVDENGMGGIELSITNKSDERFASHTLDDATVNGGTYLIYYYAEVKAGETANEVVAFDGVTSIDELKDIHFQLTIYETTKFADLGVYDINIE